MIHLYSGKSLLELRDKFGLGASRFYDNSWWLEEDFAKDKVPKGTYEIDLGEDLVNLTFAEQKKKPKKGFTLTHPAILAEAILTHYQKTKERLLERIWVRTFLRDSGGLRVFVGHFDEDGLHVGSGLDDDRDGYIGLSSARKFKGTLKPESLESMDASILDRLETVEKILEKHNFRL